MSLTGLRITLYRLKSLFLDKQEHFTAGVLPPDPGLDLLPYLKRDLKIISDSKKAQEHLINIVPVPF